MNNCKPTFAPPRSLDISLAPLFLWLSLFFLILLLKTEFHQEVQREQVDDRPIAVDTLRGKGLPLDWGIDRDTRTQTLQLLSHIQALTSDRAISKKSLGFAPKDLHSKPSTPTD